MTVVVHDHTSAVLESSARIIQALSSCSSDYDYLTIDYGTRSYQNRAHRECMNYSGTLLLEDLRFDYVIIDYKR